MISAHTFLSERKSIFGHAKNSVDVVNVNQTSFGMEQYLRMLNKRKIVYKNSQPFLINLQNP